MVAPQPVYVLVPAYIRPVPYLDLDREPSPRLGSIPAPDRVTVPGASQHVLEPIAFLSDRDPQPRPKYIKRTRKSTGRYSDSRSLTH